MAEQSDSLPEFEKALAELEQLVDRLESGELSLNESLASFQKGVTLTQQCQEILDRAQQTVEQLLGDEADPTLVPFEPDE